MMYVLERKDGGVTITVLYPNRIVLSDGTALSIPGHAGDTLLVEDPETADILPVRFSGVIADLDRDSVVQFGQLGFPAIEDEIAKMPIPSDIVAFHEITRADLPADETFRDAWSFLGGVVVDMPKAVEIHKERMRGARAPLLAALDIEYQRADETGDTERKLAVVAKKAALRDVTRDPGIEEAKTPDELKSVWPTALGQ